ncbi:NKD inhibitor of WNT signaling pathway naked cuticle isoform X2 [Lycorma delicatula]|uniref:NKD inhibitor of WNT signaling pathway naked cuticle isoform X2 n=1 Tax=Lycorma delicatula TaxID=130591 RepID=UPI003F514674
MKCCVAEMNETQMANHLVKWWKTKFINGYKQFTVLPTDCSEGRPSDTEELLRPQSDEPPSTTSPAAPPPLPKTPQPQLNFEGFECDVSVEGGGEGGGKDRQEFSFTLYDFDGHGKITKDDIAGLVTTIYETLGSSIRVPHYGSKTIKVKLTVSPDQKNHSIPPPPSTQNNRNEQAPPPQPGRFKRDLNVTIRERRPRRHHHRRRHSVSSSAPSEDREADISEDDEEQPHTRLHYINSRLGHPGTTPLTTSTCCGRNKKRSSSLQRQELLQIIQANMEKNNLCFQTSRKHYNNVDSDRQKNVNEGSPLTNHNLWRGHCTPRKRGPEISQDLPRPSTSPHHLKHRHREQEQARAMAQVVRWLEQEFSPPRQQTHQQSHTPPPPPPPQPSQHTQHHTKTRHEHHHIHEYIHHHYHHYQDTSVVV